MLKELEDEGFEGEVVLGGDLSELVFGVWRKVDG